MKPPSCSAHCVVCGDKVIVVLLYDGWFTGHVEEMTLRRARTFMSWGRVGNMLCVMRSRAQGNLARGIAKGWRVI